MTRAEGPSFADVMRAQPERVPDYLKAMARLHSRVHGHPGTELGSLKARLASNIRRATKLGEARQDVLLEQLGSMPEGDRLCHGDFHPLNILGPPGGEIIVDWPDATQGDPAADVCRSFVLIRPVAPEVAAAYVEAYAGVGGETQERVYRWLPFVAAARLAEGVPDEEEGLMEMAGSPGPLGHRAGGAGRDVVTRVVAARLRPRWVLGLLHGCNSRIRSIPHDRR